VNHLIAYSKCSPCLQGGHRSNLRLKKTLGFVSSSSPEPGLSAGSRHRPTCSTRLRDSRLVYHNLESHKLYAYGICGVPSPQAACWRNLLSPSDREAVVVPRPYDAQPKSSAMSNRERLLNEIQLAFNIVSQYDSNTSVVIGRATRYDSYSMRTIAFLTLAFLPATFISALSSMSFLDFDAENGWTVSSKIWLYFAIAGPVTLLIVSTWFLWQKLLPPNLITDAELGNREWHAERGHRIEEKSRPRFEPVAETFPV
jgi:hypothetical protein